MRELRSGGASYNEIAAALNQSGVRGSHGGRWFPSSVRHALQLCADCAATQNQSNKESQCKV
jgi:hypothetical protein